MFRFRWLHNGSDMARSRKRVRLMLESLEERLTPSSGNPTVTQTAGGYTALTAAIKSDTASNTNYVIQITNSFGFNSGGQVNISKLGAGSALTIEGQNGNNFTLAGNGNRLFTVGSGQNVTLTTLTLTGGSVINSKDAQGGAILDQGGNVTLSKLIVQGNTVKGGTAKGGGVYASGPGTLTIRDSILRDNSARGGQGADGTSPGKNGGSGGSAYGGGLYVTGAGWTVTLIGDTLSGNTAIGGSGGNGAPGSNATAPNTSGGDGGEGSYGGDASGGAAYFSNDGGSRLAILNDLGAPISDPSTWIDNSAQGGAAGNGGAGGNSTGTAVDVAGGQGGYGGTAFGGALYFNSSTIAPFTIGNSAFYANEAVGGKNGTNGSYGTGGRLILPPIAVIPLPGGDAAGGALDITDEDVTVVNSTVAANSVAGGVGSFGGRGSAQGGGISYDNRLVVREPPWSPQPPLEVPSFFFNNTITQNTVNGGGTVLPPYQSNSGAGIFTTGVGLTNNLIQGNHSVGAFAPDLDSGATLNNASNNFIGSMSAIAVSTSTNIVGNSQMQLGGVVGVDANGNPSGGPIYYPLMPGAVSIGAGSTSVLNTIAGVEGTTAAHATDEIGNPLAGSGAINLGAVQIPTPPTSPTPPPPSSPPVLKPLRLMAAIALDLDAVMFQDFPPILSFLNAISERFVGQPLPSTADLIPTIQGDFATLVAILMRDV